MKAYLLYKCSLMIDNKYCKLATSFLNETIETTFKFNSQYLLIFLSLHTEDEKPRLNKVKEQGLRER